MKWKWILVFFLVVSGVVWWRLPMHHCCGDRSAAEMEYEQILGRALSGDVVAVRQLYKDAMAANNMRDARRWALVGAIDGDEELINAYVALYKMLPNDAKKIDEAIIGDNLTKSGARRVALVIGLQRQKTQ